MSVIHMSVIYMSEEPDHTGFGLAKHKIGDKVRVVKVTLAENDGDDTKDAFLSVLGKTVEIAEVNLFETTNPGDPWHVAYEIRLNNTESIFLNDEELVAG